MFSLRKSTLLSYAAIVLLAFLVPPAAHTQESGVEAAGGVEGEGGSDLDYSDSMEEVFDIDAYELEESQLHVGSVSSPKGMKKIHEAARLGKSIALGPEGDVLVQVPEYYLVKKGDTMYYLSEYFFGDPELWPGIWALNPDVTNPNWIYPGQALVLVPEKEEAAEGDAPLPTPIISAASWKTGTERFRTLAFVDKDIEEETGKIIGSFQETEFLDMHHNVYIKYKEGKAPMVGSTATIYEIKEEVKDPKKKKIKYGHLVYIIGVTKIVSVDEDHKIAKGIIIEAARPVERGYLVGPLKWKFKITPPVKAALDLEGLIIAPMDDILHYGQNDTVFINLGTEHGITEGNVVYILRKRDHYMEVIGKKDQSNHFPWEQIGKAMVMEALKNTSTCLIIESSYDAEKGDKVMLKRGEF
ncbi:MAG: LysM peptidoglycan-binding domain-containing protein [Pseudomonadota bacterium]